jgi:hypothetical protein
MGNSPGDEAGSVTTGSSKARALARVLDNAVTIPGTKIRVGLDALIGLIPGGGDVAGAALSSIIVVMAMREGVPASVLWRMVANVAVDTAVGAIPVLGDLFDVAWRANARNAELLDRYHASPVKTKTRSRLLGLLVVVVLLLLVVGILTATALLLRALFGWF